MTKQEIAKELITIDWVKIQTDDVYEHERLKQIAHLLMDLPMHEVIDFFFMFTEAVNLEVWSAMQGIDMFRGMTDFKYLSSRDGTWLLEDYKPVDKDK